MTKSFSLSIFFSFCFFLAFSQNDYHTALAECGKLKYFESQQCMLGKKIFDFKGLSYENEVINSSALKGKVIVLNFWFMACPPCMAELGGLNEIVDQYKNANVAFISFTFDSKTDLEKDFFPTHKFNFKIIPDSQDFLIEELKHGWGFPTTFIVDQNGFIQKIFSGGATEEAIANKEIKENIIPELERLLSKK